ncbi:MAG: TlpA family protein disulfide reductase [Prevotella sp.]|nr:TlpA family protein disulfide reductase [Prevotella sp.]
MKKHVFLSLVPLLLFVEPISIAAQYHIVGSVSNIEGQVFHTHLNERGQKDTLNIGMAASFVFSGDIESEEASLLEFEGDNQLVIPIFLGPYNYQITADARSPYTCRIKGGGALQQDYNHLFAERVKMSQAIDSVKQEIMKDYPDNPSFARTQVAGFSRIMADKYEKLENKYIQENDNILSVILVFLRKNQLIRENNLSQKYQLIGEKGRQTIEGKLLKPLAEKASKIIAGGIVPNIIMKTPKGEEINIHEIKATIKIIDFWASWCGPCRAENPNLKKIYAKYHPLGLEIIGVSLDHNKKAWHEAIHVDSLSWIQISDLKGWNSPVVKEYNIQGIPQTFILDKDNRVIAENLRGEELEKCVARELDVLAH